MIKVENRIGHTMGEDDPPTSCQEIDILSIIQKISNTNVTISPRVLEMRRAPYANESVARQAGQVEVVRVRD
jgi:hypothetical protein